MKKRYYKEGSLSKSGVLYLKRKDREIRQFCCYDSKTCADTCPLMGEPFKVRDGFKKIFKILLCGNVVLCFENFRDLRGTKDEYE